MVRGNHASCGDCMVALPVCVVNLEHRYMEWLSSLLAFINKSPWLPTVVAVICLALLCSGAGALESLGLQEYRAWISIALLAALAITVAQLLNWITMRAAWLWRQRSQQQAALDRLLSLTPSEKVVLSVFVANQSRTVSLDPDMPGVLSLVHSQIISRVAGGPRRSMYCNYLIADWAWEHLQLYPSIFEAEI
jgi:hypothetical protein